MPGPKKHLEIQKPQFNEESKAKEKKFVDQNIRKMLMQNYVHMSQMNKGKKKSNSF